MRLSFAILAIALAATPAAGQEPVPVAAAASEAEVQPALKELLWVARPLVVFADSPQDPRFVQQLALLEPRLDEFEERSVVILTDTDPEAQGPLRLALRPRGFGLVLIDTDGVVALRRPAPTTARELINLIDRMPSRRQETDSMRR
jgi:hypothetical protein